LLNRIRSINKLLILYYTNCFLLINITAKSDYSVMQTLAKDEFKIDTNSPKMSTFSDLFICYSTLEGIL